MALPPLHAAAAPATIATAFPESSDQNDNSSAITAERPMSVVDTVASTFLELAVQRFEARHGRLATVEEENWAFEELQVRGRDRSLRLCTFSLRCYKCCGREGVVYRGSSWWYLRRQTEQVDDNTCSLIL